MTNRYTYAQKGLLEVNWHANSIAVNLKNEPQPTSLELYIQYNVIMFLQCFKSFLHGNQHVFHVWWIVLLLLIFSSLEKTDSFMNQWPSRFCSTIMVWNSSSWLSGWVLFEYLINQNSNSLFVYFEDTAINLDEPEMR